MNVTQNRSSCRSDPDRRQSNMCYRPLYARLLCLLLTVITFATSIIPAEAASENLMFDLFTAPSYSYSTDNGESGSSVDASAYFSGVNSVAWEWKVDTDYIFGYCYFTVYCNVKPDKMQVRFWTTQNFIDAEFVGRDGYICQYRVKCGTNNAYICVKGTWNNSFTGTFNVNSFVGVKDVGTNINKIDVYSLLDTIVGNTSDLKTIANATGVTIPKVYTVRRDSSFNWLTTLCYVSVLPEYRTYNNIDQISFLLSGLYLKNFDLSLCDSDGYPVHVITPDVSACEMRSVDIVGDNDYAYSYYEVTADLSSYDLKDLTIRLVFESASFVYDTSTRETWFSVNSIIETPYIEVTPWYKTFWNWLSDKWDNVTGSIKSSISSAADKITAAFAGASQQNEQLNQAGQAMSDQADSMNQSQAELDAVEKPSLDPDNFFGDMLTFDTGGLQILSALTSNAQVTSMLVVVFTFALSGYIFFGKKR